MSLDHTHDPALCSWVASANTADTDFPIQNLPFGAFRRQGSGEPLRVGVAIGDQILDLKLAAQASDWSSEVSALLAPLATGDLNALMAQVPKARRALRAALSNALAEGSTQHPALQACLVSQTAAEMALPCRIGDYTDFYVGIHHATAVGRLFRPDNPLLPNYKWVPIGYHGRASTIQPNGVDFHRPCGQVKGPQDEAPRLAPSQRLDLELELGIFIGQANAQGRPVSMDEAEDHVFGITLFNDWSARDLQAWEYQPLGPFLSKSFASTLSPWIVTLEALAPFRRPFVRGEGEPEPLPYLDGEANRAQGAIDIALEVRLQTPAMRAQGVADECISRSNFADAAYWTVAQLVAHHTVNGCALNPGDLFGSGTLSGPTRAQAGSLLEASLGGKEPLQLANGEQRTFLLDGDEIALVGRCSREGFKSIGFGPCRGTVLPALPALPSCAG
ncbi:fumarylacetoacetase [Caldimonas tepidiphila]|uniref:fumarylacetoacetase n=1 Tax=Caldimonas tepidiphila TaxID=2315841 RepID=UPI000E5B429C|nr:fumarylacetoacetase [Caldimonas tepidiphila]